MRKARVFAMALCLLASSRAIISVKTKEGRLLPLYSGYYALVIGISNYKYLNPLPNAVKDKIASLLRSHGGRCNTTCGK